MSLFTRLQIAVVDLIAVGRDDGRESGLVENVLVIRPNGSSASRIAPIPRIVHTCAIAGGATIPSCPAARAADSST